MFDAADILWNAPAGYSPRSVSIRLAVSRLVGIAFPIGALLTAAAIVWPAGLAPEVVPIYILAALTAFGFAVSGYIQFLGAARTAYPVITHSGILLAVTQYLSLGTFRLITWFEIASLRMEAVDHRPLSTQGKGQDVSSVRISVELRSGEVFERAYPGENCLFGVDHDALRRVIENQLRSMPNLRQ